MERKGGERAGRGRKREKWEGNGKENGE